MYWELSAYFGQDTKHTLIQDLFLYQSRFFSWFSVIIWTISAVTWECKQMPFAIVSSFIARMKYLEFESILLIRLKLFLHIQ